MRAEGARTRRPPYAQRLHRREIRPCREAVGPKNNRGYLELLFFALSLMSCCAPSLEQPTSLTSGSPHFQTPRKPLIWSHGPNLGPDRRREVDIACTEIFAYLGQNNRIFRVQSRQAKTSSEFRQRTGRPTFEAAAVLGDTLWLQPESILLRQRNAQVIFRHECVHLWFRVRDSHTLPPLLEEVLALGISGQAASLAPAKRLSGTECLTAEQARANPKDRAAYETWMRRAVTTFWTPIAKLPAAQIRSWLQSRREELMTKSPPSIDSETENEYPASCEAFSRYLPPSGVEN